MKRVLDQITLAKANRVERPTDALLTRKEVQSHESDFTGCFLDIVLRLSAFRFAGILFFATSIWFATHSESICIASDPENPTLQKESLDSSHPATIAIESQNIQRKIREWMDDLSSDSYATRQLGLVELQNRPIEVIQLLRTDLERFDQESLSHLIRLVGAWASNPDEGVGMDAYNLLETISAEKVTARSHLAGGVIRAIRAQQMEIASERLRRLSAFLGRDRIQILVTPSPNEDTLLINDAFQGTPEDLTCVRWLENGPVVRMEGERINRDWLEPILKMPNLRILQLRRTSLRGEDFELLNQLDSLETLEILYTPIDDSCIEVLGDLPLWGNLRLFGTELTQKGVEDLQTKLEGVQIIFGRGGFLGIGSAPAPLEVTQITPGSGAERAGMMIGDQIIRIEKTPLRNFEELRSELAKHTAGELVEVEIQRSVRVAPGRIEPTKLTLQVTLGEQNW